MSKLDEPRRFTLFALYPEDDYGGIALLRVGVLVTDCDDGAELVDEYEFIPAERLDQKAKD